MTDKNRADALRWGKTELSNAGVTSYQLDTRLLFEYVLGIPQEELMTSLEQPVSQTEFDMFSNFIQKRKDGAPVSKIIGYKEFYGHTFNVSQDVLDPRPDTEILIEALLKTVHSRPEKRTRILDLGTGSGCILISLLKEIPHATGVGVDISGEAIAMAEANAKALDVGDRVHFYAEDWKQYIARCDQEFDYIVSNPPYIPTKEIRGLESEVREFDPILALDGGDDGLDAYRFLFKHLEKLILPQGIIFFEIGYNQLNDIERIAENNRVAIFEVYKDLAGYNRVIAISTGKTEKNIL